MDSETTQRRGGHRANDGDLAAVLHDRARAIVRRQRHASLGHDRGWLVRRVLIVADLVGLATAFATVQAIFGTTAPGGSRVAGWQEIAFFTATLPVWIVLARAYHLYDFDEERTDHSTADDIVPLFHLITVSTWLLFATTWLSGVATPSPEKLVVFWALAIALTALGRKVGRAFCRSKLAFQQNTLIVGVGEIGQVVARKFLRHPEYGANLVGFVDSTPPSRPAHGASAPVLGSLDDLPQLVDDLDVQRVVVADSDSRHAATLDVVRPLRERGVQVDIVPRMFEIIGPSAMFHTVEGVPIIGVPPLRLTRSASLLKRTMDILGATIGLLVLAPFLLAIAIGIKRDSPGPVFFRQARAGAHGERFDIFKFRTMVVDADQTATTSTAAASSRSRTTHVIWSARVR